MISKVIVAYLMLLLSSVAYAESDYLFKTMETESTPAELPPIDQIWRPGLHLAAGLGIQGGVYLVEGTSRDYAAGLAIKSDVGYFISDKWSLETNSFIKFSRVNEYRVWGTELSVGFRYRLPEGWYDEQVPYMRFFWGANINVIYLDNQKLPEFEEAYSRMQFEGPMVGIAFGGMRLSEKKNVLFWEAAVTAEWLTRESGIQMEKDVPVVVARSSLDGKSQLYTIYVTMGGFLF